MREKASEILAVVSYLACRWIKHTCTRHLVEKETRGLGSYTKLLPLQSDNIKVNKIAWERERERERERLYMYNVHCSTVDSSLLSLL